MTFDEVKDLLNTLNVNMNEAEAKKLFDESDSSHTGDLVEGEFVQLFRRLTRRDDVTTLFKRLSPDGIGLPAAQLAQFLRDEQHEEDDSEHRAACIIAEHEPLDEGRSEGLMTLDGFVRYLTSPDGSLWDQRHDSVSHDMTQPLSHYYISSSHNTYLTDDQLRGPSSTEAYVKSLMRGCRCVELDCWDGADGEPVIYHGYTLTSQIFFRDVITSIAHEAFKASAYPVILSLENHCNVEQQIVMARHLRSILGERLVTAPLPGRPPTQLPSPEELKGKFLIKAKKRSEPVKSEAEGNGGGVSDTDSDVFEDSKPSTGKHKSLKAEKSKKKEVSKELSDCVVYCNGVHFVGLERAESHQKGNEMCSFSETKTMGLIETQGNAFVRYNMQHLSRTYPSGTRVGSGNYNPHDMWNAGCQIVALNFQTPGKEMDLYDGLFRQNGGCGYVLKPSCLRDPHTDFDPGNPARGTGRHPVKLAITVISGQQLPKERNSRRGSIIDPLVSVEVHGVRGDTAVRETRHQENNGLNPVWKEEFSFQLTVPELALIRFVVKDYDVTSRNDFIGQFSLPFSCLRQGYRHVHLLSLDGRSLFPATLFVHIRITELKEIEGLDQGL
ncbi:unnamed protein product [Lampetra planeri]